MIYFHDGETVVIDWGLAKAKLEKELPIEPDISMWFGMFDAPL